MKRTDLMVAGSILLAASLAGCGSGGDGSMAGGGSGGPGPSGQNLDTAAVLALASQSSETASPLSVNDDAVTVTGSSESIPPAEINAP